ncbi:MAG: transcriptional regulator [Micavibrio aeruginosavorus]|uniref:Transcriptional regulator n=1 Tax=Micavibrio aeruginosavorus TaxID=349221 RepID=A0A2W5HEA8_9BACT|nr:MAG: transcriptional regulator [Micavibrio aeruginosavorus]
MQNEHIEFNEFILGLRATDKNQILQNISWKIGRQTNADMTWIADQLLKSEENESSGIGDGIAIAHLKSTPLQKPFIVIAKLDQPVEFDSLDGLPVDIVCAVLSPQMDGPLHLRRLSRVTRLLREPEIIEALRSATSEDEMKSILRIEQQEILAA